MPGIFKIPDLMDNLRALHKRGLPKGFSPGWECLNQIYRPQPGYMTIVTGIPGHGKSEVVDGILVNMAYLHGWKTLLFSPENFPLELHAVKLVEKYVGKPFKQMCKEEIQEGLAWVDFHFGFLYPKEEDLNLGSLLAKALHYKETYGMDCFVLDPWNEIDHQRPAGLSETEYISKSLTIIRRFARQNKVHVWIVAHPFKLQKNKEGGYDPPTPYDISGSAHWRNKADYCFVVHRDNPNDNQARVIVSKVKFKTLGKVGECRLDYEWTTGRFKDTNSGIYRLPEAYVDNPPHFSEG